MGRTLEGEVSLEFWVGLRVPEVRRGAEKSTSSRYSRLLLVHFIYLILDCDGLNMLREYPQGLYNGLSAQSARFFRAPLRYKCYVKGSLHITTTGNSPLYCCRRPINMKIRG